MQRLELTSSPQDYSEDDYTRLWQRFPCIIELVIGPISGKLKPIQICWEDWNREVVLSIFHLAILSRLKDLRLTGELSTGTVLPSSIAFSQLSALANLQSLSLCDLSIEDTVIKAVLPSMPQLRSLRLVGCQYLTYRIIQSLPHHLDLLDVSDTPILGIAYAACEEEFAGHSSTELEGTRTNDWGTRCIERLIARNLSRTGSVQYAMGGPAFDRFLEIYNGSSLRDISISVSGQRVSNDLVRILAETPNLLKLDLGSVRGLDQDAYNSISQLASLGDLNLFDTSVSDECLIGIAKGPLRHSLRHINLRWCRRIHDIEGVRRLFSESFTDCYADGLGTSEMDQFFAVAMAEMQT